MTTVKEYNPNKDRLFNQFSRSHYDQCEYENMLKLGSKPMKYFVNNVVSPQSLENTDYTTVGNKKQYNVENIYSRPLPSRLNPIYPSFVLPYSCTQFLGNESIAREYVDTSSNLRNGLDLRSKKSGVLISEVQYDRWNPGVNSETVQNAGQFSNMANNNYFDYREQNNVLFANSAWPYSGISSRNQMHNLASINKC